MATKAEIEIVEKLLHENRPHKAFENVAKAEMGVLAVIRYLHRTEEETNSKDISRSLGISSARMAILLKKLENRNWITKVNSPTDARAVVVCLSDKGKEELEKKKKQMEDAIGEMIDEVGVEELEKMFQNLNKIKDIMRKNVSEEENPI